MIEINLSRWAEECQICGEYDYLDFCLPFYEEPQTDMEIGEKMPNGDTVGGMSCCGRCWAYYQKTNPAPE